MGRDGPSEAVFVGVLVLHHASVLLAGNYLAFRARRIDTRFSESRWVTYSMLSTAQVLAFAVPLLLAVVALRRWGWRF